MERMINRPSPFGVVSVDPQDSSEDAAIAMRQSTGLEIASKSQGQLPAPPFISSPIEGMPGRFSKIWEMWFTRVWQNRLGGAISESPEDGFIRHAFHDVQRSEVALIHDLVAETIACIPPVCHRDSIEKIVEDIIIQHNFIKSLPNMYNAIRFDLQPKIYPVNGLLYWDEVDNTLATVLDSSGGVTLQHGQEILIRCVNKTGTSIPDGSVVYVNDAQGNRPTIALAIANDYSKCKVIGMTTQTIANNAEGFVTTFGLVRGVNTSGLTDGAHIYLSASTPGAFTTTVPSSPNFVVCIGCAMNSTVNGLVFINTRYPLAADNSLNSPGDNTIAPTQLAVKNHMESKKPYHGIYYDMVNRAYETTISYDLATRTFTITPTGSTFRIWVDGVLYTKTGAQSVSHAATEGSWFFYFNTSGVLVASQTAWSILSDVMVGLVYYDASTPDYLPIEERHHFDRDREWHESQHFAIGTYLKLSTQCLLADYALTTGTDVATTWSLSAGVAVDEDINTAISALADGGPYQRWSKSGASGVWRRSAASLPYHWTAGGYLNYNQLTGGSWQLTQLSNTDYVNYYVFLAPSTETAKQILVIPGQAIHTTLGAAQSESPKSLDLTGFPSQEYLALYKITMQAKAGNANTGKCEISSVERLPTNRSSISSSASPNVHNSLSGRSDAGTHPAASVTFAPSVGVGSATVQDAIQEVYDESERSGAVSVHAAVQTGIHGLAITAGKTLTVTQSLTFAGTDGRTYTFPTTNATLARTDAGQTFTGQQTISHTIAGQLLLQGYANSVASALNGEILLGSTEAYRCRIGMDAQTGNTTLYIDSTYNSALALIKLRTRTAGTPVDCLTLSGSLATFGTPVKASYQSSDGTSGLTATRTFYAASSSGGAVTVLNTVTIKDGIITAWTQA